MYRLGEAARLLGYHPQTLRRWAESGEIECVRIGKERRVPASEIRRLLGQQNEGKSLLYGRVSGQGQKDDLARQLTTLQTWATEQYPQSEIVKIKDVGSGLNPRRKGLIRLFSLVQQRQVKRVVVTYKERLARFGFEYIEMFCNGYGVEIVILNPQEETTPEQELVDDLIAIVTSFAGRLYGLRSGKVNELVQCLKKATSL